jgi:hypothetical protein
MRAKCRQQTASANRIAAMSPYELSIHLNLIIALRVVSTRKQTLRQAEGWFIERLTNQVMVLQDWRPHNR